MVDRRRAYLVLASVVGTFVLVRTALTLSPNSDFGVAGFNIHHLFVGLLLILAGGVPLVLMPGRSPWLDAASLMFGCGLALALDEWVYLIVTDGSNASYLLPVSFWGGVVVVALACGYVVLVLRLSGGAEAGKRDHGPDA